MEPERRRCQKIFIIRKRAAFGINVSGKYNISGDQITITYSLLGMENTWTQSFSKSGKTITIGGTDFTKQGFLIGGNRL